MTAGKDRQLCLTPMNTICSSTDDIRRAINGAQSGDHISIRPGYYIFSSQMLLMSASDVVIEGDGAMLHTLTPGRIIGVQNCYDLTMRGLRFHGNGYTKDGSQVYFALLEFMGVNEGGLVEDCHFEDSGDHGGAHLNQQRTTDGYTFRDCSAVRCGHLSHPTLIWDGAGFALGGSWNTFERCWTHECVRGWEIETGDKTWHHPSRNISIRNCRGVRNLWQDVTIMREDGDETLCSDIVIEDNEFVGWAEAQSPIAGVGSTAIYFGGGSASTIRGNRISQYRTGIGIHLGADFAPVSGVRVSDNSIHDVSTGIHMGSTGKQAGAPDPHSSRDVQLSGNWIRRCVGNGMNLYTGCAKEWNNDAQGVGKDCEEIHWEEPK